MMSPQTVARAMRFIDESFDWMEAVSNHLHDVGQAGIADRMIREFIPIHDRCLQACAEIVSAHRIGEEDDEPAKRLVDANEDLMSLARSTLAQII